MSSLRRIRAVFILFCVIGFSFGVVSVDAAVNDELLEAAMTGNTRVVKNLLANGADVNASDAAKRTALMLASFKGNSEVLKLLLANGADVNAKTV